MKDHAMEHETLTRVRLHGGRYEGVYTGPGAVDVEAVHEGKVVAVADVTAEAAQPGRWRVALDLPPSVIGDGVQVIALRSTASGAVLDRITLMAGEALNEDIRADLALLRDELEMLKRAFRRHCVETAAR